MNPQQFVELFGLLRRNGLLSPLSSIAWRIGEREIEISTQEGRVLRPLAIIPIPRDRETAADVVQRVKRSIHEHLADETYQDHVWGTLISGTAGSGESAPDAKYHSL